MKDAAAEFYSENKENFFQSHYVSISTSLMILVELTLHLLYVHDESSETIGISI